MSKEKIILDARNKGMRYALDIVEKSGIESLRDEISMRNIADVSVLVPAREMQKVKRDVTERTIDVVAALSVSVLLDMGFAPDMAKQYYAAFLRKTVEVVTDPDRNMTFLTDEIYKKTGIDIKVRKGLGK